MISLLKHFGQIMNLGFVTAWIGLLSGLLISYIIPEHKMRAKGIMMGFVGGLMLAIISIDMIPESISRGNSFISVLGILIGLALALSLEGFAAKRQKSSAAFRRTNYMRAAILMAIAMGLDNLPGGLALGSMYTMSRPKGFEMATVLMIHGIPEGLSLGMFFSESNIKIFLLVVITILISLPMAAGSLIGGLITEVSSTVLCLSISLACGLMLYITFREIMPKTQELWSGRLSSVGSVLGLITGILIMMATH